MDNHETQQQKGARLVEGLTRFYGKPLPDDWRDYLTNPRAEISGVRVCDALKQRHNAAFDEVHQLGQLRREVEEFLALRRRESGPLDAKLAGGLDMGLTGEAVGKMLATQAGLQKLIAQAEARLETLDQQQHDASERQSKFSALLSLAEAIRNNKPITKAIADGVGCDLRDFLTDEAFTVWELEQHEAEARRVADEERRQERATLERRQAEIAAAELASQLAEIDAMERYELVCLAFPNPLDRSNVSTLLSRKGDHPPGRAAFNEFVRVASHQGVSPLTVRLADRLQKFDAER